MNFRTGIGYDVHRLVESRPLIIGGVTIPHEKGLLGHSDADVLLHAVCDALLGAAAMGDIGQHFPDSDPQWKGADSQKLLKAVVEKVAQKKIIPHYLDCVVIAEAPKLSPHRDTIKKNLMHLLRLDDEHVNVKATTEEGLGFTGKKEGIAAWAIITVKEES